MRVVSYVIPEFQELTITPASLAARELPIVVKRNVIDTFQDGDSRFVALARIHPSNVALLTLALLRRVHGHINTLNTHLHMWSSRIWFSRARVVLFYHLATTTSTISQPACRCFLRFVTSRIEASKAYVCLRQVSVSFAGQGIKIEKDQNFLFVVIVNIPWKLFRGIVFFRGFWERENGKECSIRVQEASGASDR